MTRLAPFAAAIVLGACAANFGGPRDIEVPTAALHAHADASPAAVAEALQQARVEVAFLFSTRDAAWFADVAAASGLQLSGPASMGEQQMAFLAPEPVGDTTLSLQFEGGSLNIQDALYEIDEDRLLDLIAFRIEQGAPVRAVADAVTAYIATDVANVAALVVAVMVPDAATGDTLARLLAPAYYDTLRCDAHRSDRPTGEHVRVFFGPEARMFCAGASTEIVGAGELLRAELVMGRR